MQLLLATIALAVFAGLASHSVGGRIRFAVALLAIGVTATYALFPRYM